MKSTNLFLLFSLILFTLLGCSKDKDDLNPILPNDSFNSESDLYEYISKVTNDETICIDFVYPLNIIVYNQFNIEDFRQLLNSDSDFFSLINNLDFNQSISLSYPITSTYANGDLFEINSNEELADVIESCLREDEIENNYTVFSGGNSSEYKCSWKITQLDDGNGLFNNSIMNVYIQGLSFFYHNGNSYEGNYIFYYINDEMHLNFNFIEDEAGEIWNYDWKVIVDEDDYFEIENHLGNTIAFEKECQHCNTLTFNTCELENATDVGEFLIYIYNKCIYSNQNIYENLGDYLITVYLSNDGAESLVNNITSNILTNITNPQFIYYRIDNIEDDTYEIIEVNLEVNECP